MKWQVFATIVVAGLLVWFISNSTCSPDPYAPPAVATASEYSVLLKEAEKLSSIPLEKFDAGEPLNEHDIDSLKRGNAITRGLIGFRPQSITLYIGLAKGYLAVDDYGLAHQWAQDGIGSIDANTRDPRLKIVEAELHYISSMALAKANDYVRAEMEGINSVDVLRSTPDTKKDNPAYPYALASYMAQLASVKIQLSQTPPPTVKPEDVAGYKKFQIAGARQMLHEALAAQPNHPRAAQLLKLIGE